MSIAARWRPLPAAARWQVPSPARVPLSGVPVAVAVGRVRALVLVVAVLARFMGEVIEQGGQVLLALLLAAALLVVLLTVAVLLVVLWDFATAALG